MPDNRPIDELFIEIEATDKSAQSSIDKISKSLEKLQSALSGLDKLNSVAQNINALMKPFEKNKGSTNNLNEFAKSLKKLSNIENFDNTIKKVEQLYSSVSKFNELPTEVNKTIQALGKLASSQKAVSQTLNKATLNAGVKPKPVKEQQPTVSNADIDKSVQSVQKASAFGKSAFSNLGNIDTSSLKTKLSSALSGAGENFSKFSSKGKMAFEVVKMAISKASSVIGNFGRKSISALKKVPAKVKEAGNHFKKLAKQIIPASKSLEGLTNGFKMLFNRVFLTGLMWHGFFKMMNAAKEGIQNVAQSVDNYNKSMSTVATSTNYLKNALAASLAPTLNAIAPIIDKIVDKFVSLIEIFSQVVAKITGQSTFVKAKKVQVNYAESIDSAGKSAKSASKAVKEYQKTISAFDEANLIKTKADADTDSSGTTAGNNFAFDEVKVADEGLVGKIGKMIDDIKNAFSRGDYYEAGKIFADNLNSVLAKANSLDWNGIQNKISNFVTSIATTINGAVENTNFSDIGELIANLYNTTSTAVNDFIYSINWDSMGLKIAEGLNGLLTNINVDNVAKILMTKFTIITDLIYGFVTEFDFNKLGSTVSELLTSAFDLIDFKKLTVIISDGLKGVLDTLITFFSEIDLAGMIEEINVALEGIDWDGLGNKVAELLQSIDWVGIFNSLVRTVDVAIGGLLNLVSGFLEEMDWEQAVTDLLDMISGLFVNIDWDKLTQNLSRIIGDLVGIAIELSAGLILGIDKFVDKIVQDIKDYFAKYFTWDDEPKDIIEGLFQGMKDAFVNVGNWINDNIFKPFMDGVKSAFGIHSPSIKMAEIGGYLIDGMKNGIGDVWAKIKEKFENFKNSITNWFRTSSNKFKSFGTDLVNSVKDGIGDIWSKVKSKFTDFFDSIKNFFKGKSLFNIEVEWDTTSIAGNALSKAGLPGLPKLSFRESGGFPDYGEVFVARENGMPEMVGKFGNRSMVANNDQIVAGISKGVYNAVISAMSTTQGMTMQSDRTTNINLKLDRQTIASAVYDVNANTVRRKPVF